MTGKPPVIGVGVVLAEVDLLAPFRLRTVRVGVQATFLLLLGVAFVPLLSRTGEVQTVPFVAVLLLGMVGAIGIAMLPWQRLVDQGRAVGVLYAWSVLDIVLISLLVALSGGGSSELFWIYTLTTVFFAASYPRLGQLSLLAFTFACYGVVLALDGWSVEPGLLVTRFTVLTVVAFMASFLARELARQMAGHADARQDAEQRALLLAMVAEAGRSVNALDPDTALKEVVAAAIRLGYDSAGLCLLEEDRQHYRVFAPSGLPFDLGNPLLPADRGLIGMIQRAGSTVVVGHDDARGHGDSDLVDSLRETGSAWLVGVPITVDGRLSAVLGAGRSAAQPPSEPEVESLELLAAQGGAAMANAARFEEKRRTAEQLEEVDRLKTEFLTTVSHELRTPLTVIAGVGKTLAARWEELDPAQRTELFAALDSYTARLNGLILSLLDFTQLQAGELEAHPRTIDLGLLARSVVSQLRTAHPRRAIEVEISDELAVRADPALLERALHHLLANAIQHTPPDTTARMSAAVEGDSVRVTVSDDGPGMRDDLRLGATFARGSSRETQSTPGMGLGLPLVKRVLELHGSQLEVHSTPGRGTACTFALPEVHSVTIPGSLAGSS